MLEKGEIRVCELIKIYHISISAVYKWKKKFGSHPPDEKVVIEKDSDFLKAVELRKQVSSLEQMIGRQQMKIDYYEEVVKQASTHFKTDIEKKFSARW